MYILVMEEWKDIEGYEGLYQVSNLGRVKSLPRYWVRTERILTKKGYPYVRVCLFKGTKRTYLSVHRLVAEAFIPNPDNKPIIDHIDGNPNNNSVSNLRWVDFKENSNNPISIERMSNAMKGNQNRKKDAV